MADEFDPNLEEAESDGGEAPAPDPVAAQLDIARQQAALYQQEAERAREWQRLAQAQIAGWQHQQQQPQYAEEPEPDLEDPSVKKYVDARIRAHLQEVGSIYQQHRQQDLNFRIQVERDRAATILPQFTELEGEVTELLSQFPPEVRASPGAIEEAYYRVLGRYAMNVLRNTGSRPANVASSARTMPENYENAGTRLDDEDRRYLREKFDNYADEQDVGFFANNSVVNLSQFEAYQAKRSKGNRR